MFDHETQTFICPNCNCSLGGGDIEPGVAVECASCPVVVVIPLVVAFVVVRVSRTAVRL